MVTLDDGQGGRTIADGRRSIDIVNRSNDEQQSLQNTYYR
jgi:hypothetical protein